MAHSTVLIDVENCGRSKQTWFTEIYSCISEPGKVVLFRVICQLSSPAGSECSNTPILKAWNATKLQNLLNLPSFPTCQIMRNCDPDFHWIVYFLIHFN